MELISHLLIERYQKRGILVELSYPDYKNDIFSDLQKTMKKNDANHEENYLFLDLHPIDNFIVKGAGEQEGLSPVTGYTERHFLNVLEGFWKMRESIIDNLSKKKTVFVSNYVYNLVCYGFSENAFGVRRTVDRQAFITLTGFLKGLIVPDLILSFNDNPSGIESDYKKKIEALGVSLEDQEKEERGLTDVIYTKTFQKEFSKGTIADYFDSVRNIGIDSASVSITAIGSMLATKCQKEYTQIKFY